MGSKDGDPIMEQLICKCGNVRDYVIKSGKRAGKIHTYCKGCLSKQGIEWQKKNGERSRENQRRYWRDNPHRAIRAHMRRYNSDEVWYLAKLAEQNGLCAICGKPETSLGSRLDGQPKRLAVDHCHKTDKLRGLLCVGCNTKVATLEMHDWLDLAVAYLNKYQP